MRYFYWFSILKVELFNGLAILSTFVYSCQVFHQVQELSTGEILLQPRTTALIDLFGDQVLHFFLSNPIDFYGAMFLKPTLILWIKRESGIKFILEIELHYEMNYIFLQDRFFN